MKNLFIMILLIFPMPKAIACDDPEKTFSRFQHQPEYTIKGPFTLEQLADLTEADLSRHGSTETTFIGIPALWFKIGANYRMGDEIYFVRLDLAGNFSEETFYLVRNGCIIGGAMWSIA